MKRSGLRRRGLGYPTRISIDHSFTVTSPKPPEHVFDYLADLSNLADWDPETKATEQMSDGDPVRVGATFTLRLAEKLGAAAMEYEILELERPRRIVIRGSSETGGGVDTYTISPTADGGSEVVYETEIELTGLGKLTMPLASVAVKRSAKKTQAGLERAIGSA